MEESYHPISLNSLKDCFKDLSFDIFLLMPNGKFLKAFAKDTGLDFGRLAHYEAKGVESFYVRTEDVRKIDQYLARSPMMTLQNESSTPEVKKRAFFAVMEQSLCEAFSMGNASPLNVAKTFQALKVSLQNDKEFLKSITLLLKVCGKDDLLLKHSITASVYSYVAAQISGMCSERTMKIILFASFFHDLGKTKLPADRRMAYENKSTEEIIEFRNHPQLTLDLFQKPFPFADEEIRRSILQHRERLDGKGYPHGIRGPAVYGMAKIVAIGDALSELTLGMEDGHFYSRPQAVATMMADEGRFDKKLLGPFAQVILRGAFIKSAA